MAKKYNFAVASLLVNLQKFRDAAIVGLFYFRREITRRQLPHLAVIGYTFAADAFAAARLIGTVAMLQILLLVWACRHKSTPLSFSPGQRLAIKGFIRLGGSGPGKILLHRIRHQLFPQGFILKSLAGFLDAG